MRYAVLASLVALLIAPSAIAHDLASSEASRPPTQLLKDVLSEVQAIGDAALDRVTTHRLVSFDPQRDVLTCSSSGALIAHASATGFTPLGGGGSGQLLVFHSDQTSSLPDVYAIEDRQQPRGLVFGAGPGELLQLEASGELIVHVTIRTTADADGPCVLD